MKLKISILAAVFTAGLTASFAFAHGGPGKGDKGFGLGKNGCRPVHVRGTVAPQTLTVTSTGRDGKTTTTVLQVGGGTGQTVRVDALACKPGTGTTATLQAKAALLSVRTQRPTTTQTTTTAPTTTSG